MIVTLSRPAFAAYPRMIPNAAPGFSSTLAPGPQARTISAARSQKLLGIEPHDGSRNHAEIR